MILGSFLAMVALSVVAAASPLLIGGLDALSAGAAIVMWFSLAALACATTLEQGRTTALMWSGIVASAGSAAGWLGFRFQLGALTGPDADLWLSWLMPSTCWTGLCAVVGLVMQQRQTRAVGLWLRRATIAGAAVLAGSIPPVVWLDLWWGGSWAFRIEGALAVLVGLGMVATMILARLRQLEGVEGAELVRLDFTATCPRCALRQPLVTGGDVCSQCGLHIKVIVP
jgi:hypothetical protein